MEFDRLAELQPSYAILDAQGRILAVSAKWRQFADDEGLRLPNHGVGANYLDYSRPSRRVHAQLQNLLANRVQRIAFIYPCHSPGKRRWCVLYGFRGLPSGESGGIATLFHVEMTALLLAPDPTPTKRAALDGEDAVEVPDGSTLVELVSDAFRHFLSRPRPQAGGAESDSWAKLTAKESEVARLAQQGRSNGEIAEALGLSINTVKRHITSIMKKQRIRLRSDISSQ